MPTVARIVSAAALMIVGVSCNNSINLQITYEVLSHMRIGRCILLTDVFRDHQVIEGVKFLNQRNILTVVMNIPNLVDYLYYSQRFPAPHREAVVGGLHLVAASNIFSPLYFNQGYRAPLVTQVMWLVFPTGSIDAIGFLRVPYNCQLIICYKDKPQDKHFGLFELYQRKSEPDVQYFGNWTQTAGLKALGSFFLGRRYDFEGTQLVMLRSKENGFETGAEEANVELWLAMGEMMNFSTYMITRKKQPQVIADVNSMSLAFHANALEIDKFALQTIAPIRRKRMFMYVRHEIDERSRWMAYLRPLSRWVWLCLICTLLSASFCLTLIAHSASKSSSLLASFVHYGFTPFDSICNQGGASVGNRFAIRLVVGVLRLVALTIAHAYSGVIISTLTLQYPIFPFNDLIGFVKSGQYQMGAVNDTFGVGYFQFSRDQLAMTIANSFFEDISRLPTTSLEGLKRCCTSKYAFIAEEYVINSVDQSKIPCRILRTATPAFVTYAGMRLDEQTQFRSVFFYSLLFFYSTGILHRLEGKAPLISSLQGDNYEEVELSQVYSLLTILLVGILVSQTIFIIEKYMKHRQNLAKNRKNRRIVLYDGLWRYAPKIT